MRAASELPNEAISARLIKQLTLIEEDVDLFLELIRQQQCTPKQAFEIVMGDCILLYTIHIQQILSGDARTLMAELENEIKKLSDTIQNNEFSTAVLGSLKARIKPLKAQLEIPLALVSFSTPIKSEEDAVFVAKRARVDSPSSSSSSSSSSPREAKRRGDDNPKVQQGKRTLAKLIMDKTKKTLAPSELDDFYALLSKLHKLLEKKNKAFFSVINKVGLGQIYQGSFNAFKELRDENPDSFNGNPLVLCYSYETGKASFIKPATSGRPPLSLGEREKLTLMAILDDENTQYAIQREFIEFFDPDLTEETPSAEASSPSSPLSRPSPQSPSSPPPVLVKKRGSDNPRVQQGKKDLAQLIEEKTGKKLVSPALDAFYDLLSKLHKLLDKRNDPFFKVIHKKRLTQIYTGSFTALKELYEQDVAKWERSKPYYSYDKGEAGYAASSNLRGPLPGGITVTEKTMLNAIFDEENADYAIQREFIEFFAPDVTETASPSLSSSASSSSSNHPSPTTGGLTNSWPRFLGGMKRLDGQKDSLSKDSPSSDPIIPSTPGFNKEE